MSQARLTELRGLLYEGESKKGRTRREVWAAILDLFKTWDDATCQIGLDYAAGILESWPDGARHYKLTSLLGPIDVPPHRGWPLVRSLAFHRPSTRPVEDFERASWMSSIKSLEVECPRGGVMPPFLASSHLGGLSWLSIRRVKLDEPRNIKLFEEARFTLGLKSLKLRGTLGEVNTARHLFEGAGFGALGRLELILWGGLGLEVAAELGEVLPSSLEELVLEGGTSSHLQPRLRSIGAETLEALFSSPAFSRLRAFEIRSAASFDLSTARALASPPRSKALERLSLSTVRLTDESLIELASSDSLPKLAHLSVGFNNRLTGDGVQALVRSPLAPRLKSLDLCFEGGYSEVVSLIAASRDLGDLETLRLDFMSHGNPWRESGEMGCWHEVLDSKHMRAGLKRDFMQRALGSAATGNRDAIERLALERGLWGLEGLDSERIVKILLGEASLPDPGHLLDEILQRAPSQACWSALWGFFARVRDYRDLRTMLEKAENILRGWPESICTVTNEVAPLPWPVKPNPSWRLARRLFLECEGPLEAKVLRDLADPRRLRRIVRIELRAERFPLDGIRALAMAPGMRQVNRLIVIAAHKTEGAQEALEGSPWMSGVRLSLDL